jgi:hypothetical protein
VSLPERDPMLIRDHPSSQKPSLRWFWRALTSALWLALLIAIVPSALAMASAMLQWVIELGLRDWIIVGALSGLVVQGVRNTRQRDHQASSQRRLVTDVSELLAGSELEQIRVARRIVVLHDAVGLISKIMPSLAPMSARMKAIPAIANARPQRGVGLIRRLSAVFTKLFTSWIQPTSPRPLRSFVAAMVAQRRWMAPIIAVCRSVQPVFGLRSTHDIRERLRQVLVRRPLEIRMQGP